MKLEINQAPTTPLPPPLLYFKKLRDLRHFYRIVGSRGIKIATAKPNEAQASELSKNYRILHNMQN